VKKGVWDDEEDYDSDEAEGEFGLDSNPSGAGGARKADAKPASEGVGQKASAAASGTGNN